MEIARIPFALGILANPTTSELCVEDALGFFSLDWMVELTNYFPAPPAILLPLMPVLPGLRAVDATDTEDQDAVVSNMLSLVDIHHWFV